MRVVDAKRYAHWASASELEAASRLRFQADRDRTISARGLAREVLAEHTKQPADALCFRVGPHGKPSLASGTPHFNLSHSGDYVALAVHPEWEVGIDIEDGRAAVDLAGVAPTVFTDAELAEIEAAPEAARRQLFFRLWTRKEAVLKVWGTGLSLDPREVHVGLGDRGARVVHPAHPACRVLDLEVERPLAGAIAWIDSHE